MRTRWTAPLIAFVAMVVAQPAFAEAAGGGDSSRGLVAIAAGLAIGIAAVGAGLGQGRAVASAMESIGRNPNAADRILGERGRLGGDIFIHGSCVTIGCVPIEDDGIEE